MVVLGFSTTLTLGDRGAWAACRVNRSANSSFRLYRKRSAVIRAEVRFVNGDDAKKLVTEEGFTVLDVRDRIQYERARITSCCHVPLFVENQDNDLGTIIKRTVHNNFSGLFFGLPFTKPNPDFVQSVKQQFPPGQQVAGGVPGRVELLVISTIAHKNDILAVHWGEIPINTCTNLLSAAAANTLENQGFENVACLTSGLQSVKPGTFDSVGSTELQDAGKAGLVTIQGKISAVLGTVLICAFLFITFFPEQAEKLLQMSPAS